MDWIFKKDSPTTKDQQRSNERVLRKVNRDIDQDRRRLERDEKQLELEIKKAAKENNVQGCKILAKQLVQLRKQKTRTYQMNAKVSGIKFQNKAATANINMADAMATTAKTMKSVNVALKPENIASNMRTFKEASMKIDMSEEMINDTLDDIFDESGDEEESDAIVTQVLDEIGIEISGKLRNANTENTPLRNQTKSLPSDKELEEQLAKLRN